jgi:cob(I)alamin adenosyltransferase
MKIYTKKGDNGNTTVVGGIKLRKDNNIIAAYGTIDQLIAQLGMVYSLNTRKKYFDICDVLGDKLMLCASNVACVSNVKEVKEIVEEDVKYIEDTIDELSEDLNQLENFVFFKGQVSSSFNVLRTLTRKVERKVIRAFYSGGIANENVLMVIKYLNRLSDLFFVLARHSTSQVEHGDINEEINWK